MVKFLLAMPALTIAVFLYSPIKNAEGGTMDQIRLPLPERKGAVSVEEALAERRSRRKYTNKPLSLNELSQVLWSAQGITSDWGGRTAPSAGATYPIEVYTVVGNVENLNPGVYHYIPLAHSLALIADGDIRRQLSRAALGQEMVREAPVTLVIAAVYERTTARYGGRGIRYVYMEAGHIGENIYLQAESLNLATVAVGAFDDAGVKSVLGIKEEPLYLMPLGKKLGE